jgi:hypothetical protein
MVEEFQDKDNGYLLYNDFTQPGANEDTAPIPAVPATGNYYPTTMSTNWYAQPSTQLLLGGNELQGSRSAVRKKSVSQILRQKLNQLLNLVLLVVILLLATRFLLIFFKVTASMFTQWVYTASKPLAMPFTNLVPLANYNGYRVDSTILIAIGFYIVVRLLLILLLRLFLLFE